VREFTKSMMSYTWAMSLFGVQQMFNVLRPSKAAESFDHVTEATGEEFGEALKATFRAGDNLQQGVVDLTFGVFTFGMFDRGGGSRGTTTTASDIGRQSAEAVRQGIRAVGQTADAIGQTVQGVAGAAARQGVGWASTQHDARRDDDTSGRSAAPTGRAPDAQSSGGGGQGWGPMPSQSSGSSGK
jgi:Na+/H+-translocating membrane pyrophosphatase